MSTTSTIDRASLSLSIPVASVSSKENNLSIPIAIAVVVAVVIAAVVLVSIGVGYTVKIKRKKRISKETFSEEVQSHVKTVEYSGPPVEEEIGDTMLPIRAVQSQPDVANTKTVTELPPPNTRMSWIEPDSAAFSHWDGVDNQVVSNVYI